MTAWPDELAPVRRAMARAAQLEADELLDDAARESESIAARAAADAEALLEAAREDGAAAGGAAAALTAARARRAAHRRVLAERERLRDELVRRSVEAVAQWEGDARLEAFVRRLTQRCHELMGPGADVSAAPGGGVVAVHGTRRLDLSLPVLAARTATALLDEAADPWS
ncbi:hypothetical protein Q6346_08330 [Isoptericola sp. b490]|uniref:hypothetical protein n=1 Tax=Actinotalea lenta TaxID=3064654 RepID=UPI0027127D47|nr:hypothetical protein [Isoptericola sp. b490]MDO8121318.1 hypothetical protein [Isoptericola sp. b490]